MFFVVIHHITLKVNTLQFLHGTKLQKLNHLHMYAVLQHAAIETISMSQSYNYISLQMNINEADLYDNNADSYDAILSDNTADYFNNTAEL